VEQLRQTHFHHDCIVASATRCGPTLPNKVHQDHVERVMQALEHARHSWIQALLHRSHCSSSPLEHSRRPYCDRTKPVCRSIVAIDRGLSGSFSSVTSFIALPAQYMA
jgi:hypothetical protein